MTSTLEQTAQELVTSGKGILATNQPAIHLASRLEALNQSAQDSSYRDWCNLLFSTPNLSNHVSGVIMHPEAVDLATDDGKLLVDEFLTQFGV